MSLNGKAAVVTGSTSGIGLGIAEALARAGASVAPNSCTDSPEDRALAARVAAASGADVRYISADLSDTAASRALVARAAETFGGVDILVNNAGIQHVAPIDEFPVAKWDAILAINLSSAFHTTISVDGGWTAE